MALFFDAEDPSFYPFWGSWFFLMDFSLAVVLADDGQFYP